MIYGNYVYVVYRFWYATIYKNDDFYKLYFNVADKRVVCYDVWYDKTEISELPLWCYTCILLCNWQTDGQMRGKIVVAFYTTLFAQRHGVKKRITVNVLCKTVVKNRRPYLFLKQFDVLFIRLVSAKLTEDQPSIDCADVACASDVRCK